MIHFLILGTLQDPHVERITKRFNIYDIDYTILDHNASTEIYISQSSSKDYEILIDGKKNIRRCYYME